MAASCNGFIVSSPAAELPLTVAELRTHLRIRSQREDAYFADLIRTAAAAAESYTNRAWITRTVVAYFDRLCDEMELPLAPVQSVSEVRYTDADGVDQTLDDALYYVDAVDVPGRPAAVLRAYNATFPTVRGFRNDVAITAVVGYGGADAVPEPVRQAIRIAAGALNAEREGLAAASSSLPMASRDLLWPYVVRPCPPGGTR